MSSAILTNINTYPIKSIKGVSLNRALVKDTGLELDRNFVITDLNGKFITGRTKSSLVLVESKITSAGLILNAPGMPELAIFYANFSKTYQNVQVWNDQISAQHCDDKIDHWFSMYLNFSCKVYYLGEHSHRSVLGYEHKLSFADGYPLLLISEASLNALNNRLKQPVTMAQFRPNLVVSQCLDFAEDGWHKIRIGDVNFEIVKPCSRCIFTTVNEVNGQRNKQKEPLSTLKKFRQAQDKEIYFGQNLIALNEGSIKIGDKVEIISKQTAPQYSNLKL
ncbi:MOSC domain-containing protein [Thalassotalea psychrophila]|uniref:MOSC domain-containing protein n=1 Tax=Thalassotalea psychrophila TaxID=3065647 RepID=A0ABY9TSL7_9GAMM|nr:MOSC domain-containing protein [Colwelliaceae bacterium SQ149]